ncbi:MAG: oxaloacetate decarboxylase [bacterium]|jgi:2-methylisocitrate lyase-like PEP mutase family enzyme|nr:isocitrate lyase/PEP mutase family protein [Betaproteobacteria bacterium]
MERKPRATTRMRELMARPGVIVAPGVADALNACLVASEGFEAVYMTGGGTSAVRLGMPDVGLLTMPEMVDNAGRIADASGLPVIADADTGYGNPLNVRRTVNAYEKAGVAGIHLEDQELPKRCGHLSGKTLVPVEEMCNKIRAACDSRLDDDFMIIARTDALSVEGFDAAIARGRAYEAAGADMIFVESPLSMEQLEAIPKAFGVGTLFNMASSGKTPFLHRDELARLGFKLAIYPNFAILSAIPAVRRFLRALRDEGTVGHIVKDMASFTDWFDAVGMDRVKAFEEKYGLPEEKRARY